jgi:hypothetical protein
VDAVTITHQVPSSSFQRLENIGAIHSDHETGPEERRVERFVALVPGVEEAIPVAASFIVGSSHG